ncbi:MAG TPA: twin-arginine translocase TatA/TatE family subunit [Ktedonobacterales bacterium]|nr:twin-arginine translocase TatA/TatE family subunit [Ktedonobacterales bacterium]
MFGHLPEMILLLGVALLVFGPKRMIEMGSSFGKAFREFREATKEMSWSALTGAEEDTPRQTAMSKLSQFSQTLGVTSNDEAPRAAATPSAPPHTVDAVGDAKE